jgi:hypothetical protein
MTGRLGSRARPYVSLVPPSMTTAASGHTFTDDYTQYKSSDLQ